MLADRTHTDLQRMSWQQWSFQGLEVHGDLEFPRLEEQVQFPRLARLQKFLEFIAGVL